MQRLTFLVDETETGDRLDALVARRAALSRARAAELVASGAVTVDGRAVSKAYRVVAGDRIEVAVKPQAERRVRAPAVPVAYEDDDLLVVDKPAGVVVHEAPGVRDGTVVDALRAAGVQLAQRPGPDRPGIVHRLDRDVSGLLLVAKTDAAHEALTEGIRARTVRREYLALVSGAPPVASGKIEAPVGRHPRRRTRMAVVAEGRPAVTWFRVRERLEGHGPSGLALLEVRLETGRTHQIRTHLESIGHPIVGDAAYGRDPGTARRLGLNRLFLHAFRLAFDHPRTGARVELTSDLPPDLQAALERARE